MDSARPVGSGDNFLRTKLQLPLLNATYEELPRSYVVEHILTISALVKKGDGVSMAWASVYAFAIPVFLGASIIQLFLVTVSDTTNNLLGHSRKEYVVIHPGEEEESLELREASTYKDVKELALHIAAIVPTCICFFPGIVAPGIYYRADLLSLPHTRDQKAHFEEVSQKGQLEVQRDRLVEANTTAKMEAFFSMFRVINSDNIEQIQSSLLALGLPGMTLSQVTEEDVGSYNQESWGPIPKKLFSPRDEYKAVQLSSKEQFLKPIGTIELEIDCTKISQEQLVRLLTMPHAIHRLVLINPDMNIFESADAYAVLSNIHTLVIREKDPLQVDQLEAVAHTFKTIACFDVTGCHLDKDLSRSFIENHLVLATVVERSSSSERAPSFRTEFDNIQEQLDHLNRNILFERIMRGFTRDDVLYLANFFPIDGENKLFHPAAPFITKLCFFRETEVSSKQLKSLMPRLQKTFPHLRVLDLTGCKLLDSEALHYLEQYPVMNLYLDRCEGIFFRQISGSTDSYTSDPRLVLEQNRRNYLVNIEYATNRLIKLFNLGTQVIRILEMDSLRATNRSIRKGSPPQYYQIVRSYLEQCLFPEMDQMINPPKPRKAFIVVGDFQYGDR